MRRTRAVLSIPVVRVAPIAEHVAAALDAELQPCALAAVTSRQAIPSLGHLLDAPINREGGRP